MSRFPEEKQQEWKDNILNQRESGLSIISWCRKNNLAVHSFYYWQEKFFHKKIKDKSAFTEILDKQADVSDLKEKAITLEYQGIRIHLARHFSSSTLKQCLEVLKELAC